MEYACSAKLALLGGPGAGKNTFVQIVQKKFPHVSVQLISLAKPLYEVQNFIYKICGKEIPDGIQDGFLLNFLGQYMRTINPYVLLDHLAQSLCEIKNSSDMILCSDARPMDISFIKKMGFTIVYIAADVHLSYERRKKRGDLSLGCPNHITETGLLEHMYDVQISNNGSLEEYEESVVHFLKNYLS